MEDRKSIDYLFDANHAHAASLTDTFADDVQTQDVIACESIEAAVVADEGEHDSFAGTTGSGGAQRACGATQYLNRAGER